MRSKQGNSKKSRLLLEELEQRLVLSTYYIATTGNDNNAGSSTAPFATLQHAADTVQAGDTVIVRAGNYAGFVMGWNTSPAGTSSAPITFEADPNAAAGSVVINKPDPYTACGIDLEPGSDWVTVQGFTIQGGSGITTTSQRGYGIKVTGAHDSVIDNTVTGLVYGTAGIEANNAPNVVIQGNTITDIHTQGGDSTAGHGIYLTGDSPNAVITGNVMHDNDNLGIHINNSGGTLGDLTGALIAGNLIYNNHGNGINADGILDSTIENNVIYGYTGYGICFYQIDSASASTGNIIVNNTIVSTASGAGAAVRILDAATGNTVLNNVLLGGSGIALDVSSDSQSGLVSDYNVSGGTYQNDDSGSTQSLASWQSSTGQDKHSFTATASTLFVNAAANNYHLSSTSPALDAGTATDAPATDFDGNARPQGNGFDIGAYELVTNTTPAPSAASFSVSAPTAATAGTSFQIIVSALDLSNNVVAGYAGTVQFTSSDGQAVLPANYTFTAADAGVHTFSVTLKTAGSDTVTVTETAHNSVSGSASILVSSGAVSTFVVGGFPTTTTAGTSQTFTITAEDAYGNTATGYAGTVHFTSSDAQASLPADSTLNHGVGTFSATLKTAGTQSLKATDTTNSGLSVSVRAVVNPAAASTLVVSGFPSSTTEGASNNFTVTAKDLYGNTATGFTATVQFSSSDSLALLPPGSALSKGTGTFSATLMTPGTQSLTTTATSSASLNGTETGIVVQLSASAPAVTHTWQQSSPADFGSGSNSGTGVVNASTGGLQLKFSFSDEFSGTTLSSHWSKTRMSSGGSATVANSDVTLAGEAIYSTKVGIVPVEARISFGAEPWQEFGLATGLSSASGNYWALFDTKGTSNELYARVNANGVTSLVDLGALPVGFHVYRVQPVAGGFQFFIDGALKATIAESIPAGTGLKVVLSADGTAQPMQADWVHVLSYPSAGTFTSVVYDAGQTATWGAVNWSANLPAGTTITVQTRSGNTASPDSTWSAWAPVSNGGTVSSPSARYLQYRIVLTTTNSTVTPVLNSIDFSWS